MTISWNSEADAKLLSAILIASSGAIDWNKAAEIMGDGCTVSAIKHRVTRLKERANGGSPKKDNDKTNSPTQPKTKRARPMKSTQRRKKGVKLEEDSPEPELDGAKFDDPHPGTSQLDAFGTLFKAQHAPDAEMKVEGQSPVTPMTDEEEC